MIKLKFIEKIIQIFRNLFTYYRVFDWVHFLGYVLLGVFLCIPLKSNINILKDILLGSILLAYAYSLNDYYDKNKRIAKKYFVIPAFLFLVTVWFFDLIEITFSFLFFVVFTLYSWDKISFESKSIISTLSNGFGFPLLFLMSLRSFTCVVNFLYIYFLLVLLTMISQMIHEIVDYHSDKKISKKTTAVRFGVKKVILMIKLLLFFTVVYSFYFLIFSEFKLMFSLTIIFSLFIFIFLIKIKIPNRKFRMTYRYFGIVIGIFYLLDILYL